MEYTFMNGEFIPAGTAVVGVKNKALNYGLGVIEGIRGYWNEEHEQLYLFRLADHYSRFLDACRTLYITLPYSVGDLCEITVDLLKLNNIKGNIYIRPVAYIDEDSLRPSLVNGNYGIFIALVEPGIYSLNELSTLTSSWLRISSNTIPPFIKSISGYLNSALAFSDAVLAGADDAIFLTRDGNISEGSTSNLFIVNNNRLFTPPASDDIFPGLTRDTVITIAKQELGLETDIGSLPKSALYAADEFFFTGTAIQLVSVVKTDHRTIGTGSTGPVTARLQQLYSQIVLGQTSAYRRYLTPVW
ncbi:branched-chain amino acid transaminase [Alteribacter salitolerans]|uniref:branched-chain amino acid transaminase n=1 Tax=Alteribacter salitolerans TaxID=2912333 RepID=UPI0030137439